jgi:hypothetical protein
MLVLVKGCEGFLDVVAAGFGGFGELGLEEVVLVLGLGELMLEGGEFVLGALEEEGFLLGLFAQLVGLCE